jgi:hypothetical protein
MSGRQPGYYWLRGQSLLMKKWCFAVPGLSSRNGMASCGGSSARIPTASIANWKRSARSRNPFRLNFCGRFWPTPAPLKPER